MKRTIKLVYADVQHSELFTASDPELHIVSDAGEAIVQHDPEELLSILSAILNRGYIPTSAHWVVNGVAFANGFNALHGIISGEEKSARSHSEKVTGRRVVLTATEVIISGSVWWRTSHEGKNHDLTKGELLRAACDVFLRGSPRLLKS